MAQNLAIIGNVSLDRVRTLGGAADATPPTLGGAALNIAAAYALWGGRAKIFAHLGPNVADIDRYLRWMDLSGCQRSQQPSPEFVLVYDQGHSLQGVEFDEGAIASARLAELPTGLPQGSFVHLSLRKPYSVADAVALRDAGFRLSMDVLLSSVRMHGDALADVLADIEVLFCNREEWRYLQSTYPVERVRVAVVTSGSAPVELWHHGSVSSTYPVTPAVVVDPTGAGDSFCGGFLRGYLAGLASNACVALGIGAARLAIGDFGVLHILGCADD